MFNCTVQINIYILNYFGFSVCVCQCHVRMTSQWNISQCQQQPMLWALFVQLSLLIQQWQPHSFNGHLPGQPGWVGLRMSSFVTLLELRMMEMVVTTGVVRGAKLQSNCHHQPTNTWLFTGWMPFPLLNQHVKATNGKISTSVTTDTDPTNAHWLKH